MIVVVACDQMPPGWTVAYMFIDAFTWYQEGSWRGSRGGHDAPNLLVDHGYHSGFNALPLARNFMPCWRPTFKNFTAPPDRPAFIRKAN